MTNQINCTNNIARLCLRLHNIYCTTFQCHPHTINFICTILTSVKYYCTSLGNPLFFVQSICTVILNVYGPLNMYVLRFSTNKKKFLTFSFFPINKKINFHFFFGIFLQRNLWKNWPRRVIPPFSPHTIKNWIYTMKWWLKWCRFSLVLERSQYIVTYKLYIKLLNIQINSMIAKVLLIIYLKFQIKKKIQKGFSQYFS